MKENAYMQILQKYKCGGNSEIIMERRVRKNRYFSNCMENLGKSSKNGIDVCYGVI